jgi:hypothetical protein
LSSHFGSFTAAPSQEAREALFKKFGKYFAKSNHLEAAARYLTRDINIFEALRQFLEDGGRFELLAVDSSESQPGVITLNQGGSHYSARPLRIYLIDDHRIDQHLFHELLHYITDKMDSILWEFHSQDGLDHFFLINALEDRYRLIRAIRSGRMPLDSGEISGLGRGQPGRTLAEQLRAYIQEGDWQRLHDFVGYDLRYYKYYVNIAMIGALGSVKRLADELPLEQVPITPSDLQDYAHMHALNAQILRGAIAIAASHAERTGTSFESVLGTPEFQGMFENLLKQLLKAEIDDSKGSVRDTTTRLLDSLLPPLALNKRSIIDRRGAPASLAYWIILALTGDVQKAIRWGSRWRGGHPLERLLSVFGGTVRRWRRWRRPPSGGFRSFSGAHMFSWRVLSPWA